MLLPEDDGSYTDVVLGFDDLEMYKSDINPWFGATPGRFANRIADGRFPLNGKDYQLLVNCGPNHLHGGGPGALSKKDWQVIDSSSDSVTFEVFSPDGEEGYPGNLTVRVTYTLTDDNELRIDFWASSDQDTILNLTNHAYWNLAGEASGAVGAHLMKINASRFLPRNRNCIPTGELRPLDGNVLDYRREKSIDSAMTSMDDFEDCRGFDHSYVLDKQPEELALAATYCDPASGRRMEVYTRESSVHIYTAGFFDDIPGKKGHIYRPHEAVCFECQNFPDAPNHANFPSSTLRQGEVYESATVHRFTF